MRNGADGVACRTENGSVGASMSDIWIVFTIIAAVIVLFAWDRLPVVAVCVGCALALWATGILTLNQSLAGFGDPATIFVTSLFVASAALEKTGVTAWAGQILIQRAGESRTRLIGLTMLFVGVLSALISVNGAVAALLPVVVVMAVRLGRPPSQLLMPLVFGAHCGLDAGAHRHAGERAGLEASMDAGQRGFGYFEFALVGIPLIIGGIVIAILLGQRLLPVRESKALPPTSASHARTLVEQFRPGDGLHAAPRARAIAAGRRDAQRHRSVDPARAVARHGHAGDGAAAARQRSGPGTLVRARRSGGGGGAGGRPGARARRTPRPVRSRRRLFNAPPASPRW